MKKSFMVAFLLILSPGLVLPPSTAHAARATIPQKVSEPYLGATVVNADTGEIILEKNADVSFYPASIVKLMMLLIIQEKIEAGDLRLSDPVTATAAAARMGGSQVYLAENETFSIEDLLYAIMIQSANDAAVALAIHVSGSKEAFVEMMNKKAKELGMKGTEFHSVHGLPPAPGQKPDVSTPRDIGILARELLKHPDIMKYTSTQVRTFRENPPFEMRSHNRLLGTFAGCDGLKTGYFRAGGYSIAASARRNGKQLIAVVAGAKNKADRDKNARKLLAEGFSKASSQPSKPAPAEEKRPAAQPAVSSAPDEEPAEEAEAPRQEERPAGMANVVGLIILIVVLAIVFFWLGRMSKRESRSSHRFRGLGTKLYK